MKKELLQFIKTLSENDKKNLTSKALKTVESAWIYKEQIETNE